MTDQPDIVPVTLGARSYDVVIGEGALDAALPAIRELCGARAVVVTDSTIAGLHLDTLSLALGSKGIAIDPIIAPPGEDQKSFSGLEALVDALTHAGVERGDTIIAFGGGVIGDLTGFAAAVYMRGIRFIQIPTTLLSQVDSSVGGKTAINTKAGKNLAGSFHQPSLVVADTRFLATLPVGELRAGYAEIVKAALIGDAAMFGRLEALGPRVLDPDHIASAIADAVRFKAAVVAEDEREAGRRALLNLGHTFAHAFEAEARGGVRHGEAVALGLALAFDWSAKEGRCPGPEADRVRAHLAAVGLPTRVGDLPGGPYDAAQLAERMRHDKKNAGGSITLILAKGIGNAYIEPGIEASRLADFLEDQIA